MDIYSVSYVCIVLLRSSNDWLVVHVFGVLLGKSLDKVNHQQSDLCACARPGLGLDFGRIQTFLPRHRTDHARTGFETGVPGQRKIIV